MYKPVWNSLIQSASLVRSGCFQSTMWAGVFLLSSPTVWLSLVSRSSSLDQELNCLSVMVSKNKLFNPLKCSWLIREKQDFWLIIMFGPKGKEKLTQLVNFLATYEKPAESESKMVGFYHPKPVKGSVSWCSGVWQCVNVGTRIFDFLCKILLY